MLSRLTRLTSMSSHIVGGLSHLWDDRTAPNNVAKGTTQELCGVGHDHGFYCVNRLADTMSTSLTTNDDPFFGVSHIDNRSEWNDSIFASRTIIPEETVFPEKDLGGRLTPEDLLPWYEKFDVTTNLLDQYYSRSRNNSTSMTIELTEPSAIGHEFSLLNECDWMAPNFNANFLSDTLLPPDVNIWPKNEGDPLSQTGTYSDYSRSAESPLIGDVDEKEPEPKIEYTPTGRIKRQCRRKTVMDIMKEACEVPDFDEPIECIAAKNASVTFGQYFETRDTSSHVDRPKARGVVVKPYVDAVTFRRRVMNRESARKYRARKRKEKFQAKGHLLELEKRNVDLKVELVGIENEIALLKKQLKI